MENKYYTPEIKEFYAGFEYEIYESISFSDQNKKWVKNILTQGQMCQNLNHLYYVDNKDKFRVKYLDKEDIESLGFNNNDIRLENHIKPKTHLYKIKEDGTAFTIQWYWHMLRNERENLIRIFKGTLHKYPYQEIFRGDIKNKSELKILLKQLNIDEN
jgi:hypothetical protein